ncbi:MAG TPA: plasmid mobilization relaxosome protein MobC [Mucilaginibacter sp.]
MSETQENKTAWCHLRLKPEEYELLNNRFKKTRFRKLSEYLRSVLLEKPVTVNYRDKAMDEVLEEMVLLRRELNAIGNNLNQAVHQINAAHGNPDVRLWGNLLSAINGKVEPAINHIKDRMNQFADLWSQKSSTAKA